jgi:hypothetical protein
MSSFKSRIYTDEEVDSFIHDLMSPPKSPNPIGPGKPNDVYDHPFPTSQAAPLDPVSRELCIVAKALDDYNEHSRTHLRNMKQEYEEALQEEKRMENEQMEAEAKRQLDPRRRTTVLRQGGPVEVNSGG